MKEFKFTKENEEKFNKQLKSYPNLNSMMLPALWLVQEQISWISPESMIFLAKKLNTSPIQIHSIASFYTMFNLKPIGTYHIELCKTLSCMLLGSEELKQFIYDTIGIKPGQTSKDGKFHFSEVECMGACSGAPMFALNGKYYENQDIKSLDKILKGCDANKNCK